MSFEIRQIKKLIELAKGLVQIRRQIGMIDDDGTVVGQELPEPRKMGIKEIALNINVIIFLVGEEIAERVMAFRAIVINHAPIVVVGEKRRNRVPIGNDKGRVIGNMIGKIS